MADKKVPILHSIENWAAVCSLLLLALLPVAEIVARRLFRGGITASTLYIYHLVLFVTFLGGTITSREGRHLSLGIGTDLLKGSSRHWIDAATNFVSVSITVALFLSSLSFMFIGFDAGHRVGLIPIRLITVIMPIGYSVIGIRFLRSDKFSPKTRWLSYLGIVAGLFIGIVPISNMLWIAGAEVPLPLLSISDAFYGFAYAAKWPLIIFLTVSMLFGTPIFVVLAGIALMLFGSSGGSLEVIQNEAYTMLTGSAMPALPLFTFAGFILSESKAGERLVKLFRAFFGWLPGGLSIMAVLVCTFFTTFTGASGVTILALGALLSYILVQNGTSEKFSTGLLTASGSIGLLFPPSLPIIIYGVVAQINIKHMFVGGIIPGILMVLTLSVLGLVSSLKSGAKRIPFEVKQAARSVLESIWEILLPVIILLGYFLGITTLPETAAVAVVYALIVEVFIKKDIELKDVPKVAVKSLPVVGGVLIILAVAQGLKYFIVDAEVPMVLSAWVQAHISSKYVFLILLNIALLITGCLMDIFSAIVVVVPLILPLGELFGINPVHLGIIFLANLELGYLTPPVGLNLFLASYRFEQPLAKIYKSVLPFFGILLVAVLLITYVPWFSTGLLRFFGG